MNLNRYSRDLFELDTFKIFNDFDEDQSDIRAVDTVTDSGTVAMGDAVNGVVVLTPSDVSVVDNDEAYLATPNENFKFGTNREIYGRWKFRWTETTANIPNIAVGFQNAVGADTIVDDTGLPKVTGSCLAVYKTDGSAVWKVASSCNGTATHTTSNKAAVEDTDYVVEILCNDWDGVSMQVCFRVNGEYLKDTNNNIIRHTVLIASATEMQGYAGIKLGASTNNDTMSMDYWYFAQTRV
jgi:hypothetical protein